MFNLVLGRWLGPAAFADLSLIITLLLLVILITATFQTTTAKFAAIYTADGDLDRLAGLRRWFRLRAWGIGAALLIFFVAGAQFLKDFFHTASIWPFVLLGIGLPMYLAQGVDRGILQGQTRFGLLSLTYQTEMWVRLVAALGLVALGLSVNGATAGLSLSLIATWLVARRVRVGLPGQGHLSRSEQTQVLTFAGPVSVALVGQVLINNSDILIVKHFFTTELAGHYAALALIGRVVFFATTSVVAVMFPIVAQKQQKGQPHRYLLGVSLGLVTLVSTGIIGGTLIVPELIVNLLFGNAYLAIAPLLWRYAVATMLYALANVIVNYRLSIGNRAGSTLAVLGGIVQVVGLWFMHASLLEVVMVQIYIMTALLVMLLAWDGWLFHREERQGRGDPEKVRRSGWTVTRRWL